MYVRDKLTALQKVQDQKVSLYIFIVLMGMLVSICIFPPQYVLAKRIADFTVHIMVGFLAMGMFFLLMEKYKFMFASFIYCGILSLFLKGTVNQGLRLATTSGTPTIRLAHFNTSSALGDYQVLLQAIRNTEADLVSVNELTPDWEFVLREDIKKEYPFQAYMVRIDPFGLGILSKKPLANIDTVSFYQENHQHLIAEYPMTLNRNVKLLTSYFLPPLTRKEYGDYRVELLQMSQELAREKGPILVSGDFNLSDWSAEMREFKNTGMLSSSRRDASPKTSSGLKTWMDFPVDHILFNQSMECTRFESITDSLGNHLGIIGDYQLNLAKNTQR